MFNRAWLAGGIPRTACVAAYEPVCAVSLADSYINRANPGVFTVGVEFGTPIWSAELGWTFNNTNGLSVAGLTASDDFSAIVRFSGATVNATDAQVFGSLQLGAKRFSIAPTSSNVVGYVHGAYKYVVGAQFSGVLAIAAQSGYRNGVLDTTAIPTGSGAYLSKMGIGYMELSDGANYGLWDGNIQALYFYNANLTPTQVRAVTDAMNMLPMRPQLPRFRSWLTGGAVTQFRKAFGLRTGSRGVPE